MNKKREKRMLCKKTLFCQEEEGDISVNDILQRTLNAKNNACIVFLGVAPRPRGRDQVLARAGPGRTGQ